MSVDTKSELTLKELILHLKEWMKFLTGQWKLFLIVAVIGGVLGGMYALSQKPVYTASLTFALEDDKKGEGLSGAVGIASSLGFDLGGGGGGAFSDVNLIQLIKSKRIIEQSLLDTVLVNGKTITLAQMYISLNGWKERWQSNKNIDITKFDFPVHSDRSKFSIEQDSVLKNIYTRLSDQNINVGQKDKKSSIISIDVKSENELFAKLLAEALAREVSDFYIVTKSKKAKLNLTILEHQADSVRAQLNSAISGVAIANDNTFNLNAALNVARTPSIRRQVDVQANTAILTELIKNLELARVTLRKETPLIQIIDSPILPLNKEVYGKVKGAVLGAFILVALVAMILLTRRFYTRVMGTGI